MAKPTKFNKLTAFLESLDFRVARHSSHILFVHPSGRPIIILPSYKADEIVKPIHLMMVRKQLVDAGIFEPEEFNLNMQEA